MVITDEKTFEDLADALNVRLTKAMWFISMAASVDESLAADVDFDRMTLSVDSFRKIISLRS
jgi:hypothetical protein